MYFGYNFGMKMSLWSQHTMMEHQNADTISEEAFRNIKTVSSLGAENKFMNRYNKIIRECGDFAAQIMKKGGVALGGMAGANQMANAFFFLISALVVYFQRRNYPTELFNAGCTPVLTESVDICFNHAMNLTAACQSICDRVSSCWFDGDGSCLVGGEATVINFAVLQSFMGLGNAFTSIQSLAKSCMSAAFFLEVIDHKDEMVDTKAMRPASNKGAIEFKDVSFKYKSRDTMILNHLNLTIRENEMIGIVGESGCGKSTILKLLMRLYAPCGGEIDWDGVNVSDLSTHWIREQISYVAQEPVLFSGTIRENLLYGREGATEAEMVAAAKRVEADSFIRQFPKGYDTYVGELGTSLSGGQKQRIAIARALLRHPRIVVLDEATSALDSQSEEIVQRAIEAIREENKAKGSGLSIVVVAHRLSSIRVCDRIVVMDEGHVVEEGTHEELVAKGGLYAGLYQTQAHGETEMATEAKEACSVKKHATSQYEMTEKKEEEEEKEDVIPDEIPEEQMKKYSLYDMLSLVGPNRYLFWVGLIGTVLRFFFPPVFGYCIAMILSMFYYFDLAQFKADSWKVILPVILTAFCTFFGTVINWGLHSTVGEDLIVSIRSKAFSKLIHSPVPFFDEPRHLPAVLTSRLGIDCRRLRDIIDYVSPIIENSLLVIGCLLLCFGPTGNWKLAIPAIILSPFLIAVEYLQALITSIITEKIDNDLTKKSGILTDYLLNIHTIHAYNLEDTLFDEMMDSMRNTDKLTNKRTWRSALGQGLSQLLPSLFMIIVLAVGSVLMVSKEASFEQVFTVMMAVYMCAQFVGINMAYMPNMKLAQKSTNNVFALLNEMNPDDACREVKTEGANGDIVFDKVEFAYPTRPEAPILKGVSFTIPKNASVAFVGHSGCGKSTIISLIQRFYKPAAGTISLNGVEVNQLNLDWYRGLLGVVNQEPVMFSGTIRENLLMGVDRAVSEEELKSVCEQALCMDFINEMPDGFETDLGATGKAVSGGQKQRLALARAILRNPAILLLDEATSALDSENQEKFLEALNGWRKSHPCTVVTVAHRLSTIVDSDIIFVVDDGRIIDQGTHETLLKSCAFYANLVRGQLQSESCVCRTNPPTTKNYIEPILGLSGTLGT